jgi:RecA/RadA recombinase
VATRAGAADVVAVDSWIAKHPEAQQVDRVGRLEGELAELRREMAALHAIVDELARH